jgi:hypothetical protein
MPRSPTHLKDPPHHVLGLRGGKVLWGQTKGGGGQSDSQSAECSTVTIEEQRVRRVTVDWQGAAWRRPHEAREGFPGWDAARLVVRRYDTQLLYAARLVIRSSGMQHQVTRSFVCSTKHWL